MQELWVSMPILRNIIVGAARTQQDLEKICAQGHINVTDLDNAETKLSLQQNCALMEAALQTSGDPFLGLHIGERTTASVLGVTGYLMESSKDLLTALRHLQAFTASFSSLYHFGIEVKGEEAVYCCEPITVWNDLSPETARQSVDIAFAGTLHILKLLTGVDIQPLRVYYIYSRFVNTTEHERILKCRPRFNQSVNALFFSLHDLQRNILSHNRELNSVFMNMLQQKQLQQNHSFIYQVRTLILELSTPIFPSLEDVAIRLHLTPRTLQRKLQEESTSFRLQVDAIKEELARNLLLSKNLSVNEIADRLGYADSAAFQRAFRQWTGITPGAYRSEAMRNSQSF